MEMATTNKSIKIESLPPSNGAAWQHSLRVYLQVMDWKHLEENHYNPSEWGWKLEGGRYHPVFTEEPLNLIDVIVNFLQKNLVQLNARVEQTVYIV